MLNNLLNTIESLEERDLSVPFTSNDINESGMIIIKSYELLGSVGLNISGLFYPVLEDLNINVPMLVVDGDFEELSTLAKQFIIAHELGHSCRPCSLQGRTYYEAHRELCHRGKQ